MAKKIRKGINGPESRETEKKGGRDRERFEEEEEEEEDEEEEEEEEEKGIWRKGKGDKLNGMAGRKGVERQEGRQC